MRRLQAADEAETHALGVRLGQLLKPPRTVLLIGELGAGKTTLARGIAQGLRADPGLVHSPTFSLVNEYPSPEGIVYHIDLYRLESLRDQYSIGLEEILGADAVVLIEWGERLLVEADSPIRIEIEPAQEQGRLFRIEGLGSDLSSDLENRQC